MCEIARSNLDVGVSVVVDLVNPLPIRLPRRLRLSAPWRPLGRSTACYGEHVSEVISQRELRNDSGRIMRALDEGRSFVLTRNSVPVGELRPLRRQRLVDARLVSELFRRAPRIDHEQFLRDLDDAVDQDAEPRA